MSYIFFTSSCISITWLVFHSLSLSSFQLANSFHSFLEKCFRLFGSPSLSLFYEQSSDIGWVHLVLSLSISFFLVLSLFSFIHTLSYSCLPHHSLICCFCFIFLLFLLVFLARFVSFVHYTHRHTHIHNTHTDTFLLFKEKNYFSSTQLIDAVFFFSFHSRVTVYLRSAPHSNRYNTKHRTHTPFFLEQYNKNLICRTLWVIEREFITFN